MSPVFSLAVLAVISLVGGGGAKARARPELGLLCTVASITAFGQGGESQAAGAETPRASL